MTASERTFSGFSLAEGWALGPVRVLRTAAGSGSRRERQMARFDAAVETCRQRLRGLQASVREALGAREAALLQAQLDLLGDAGLQDGVRAVVGTGADALRSVEAVFEMLCHDRDEVSARIPGLRASDIIDLQNRLTEILLARAEAETRLRQPHIVVAEEVHPNELAHLDTRMVLGLALERGGINAHAAVLARHLGVPAVAGLDGLVDCLKDGDVLLVDGNCGLAVLHPSEAWLHRQHAAADAEAAAPPGTHATTRDGSRFPVLGNVAILSDVDRALFAAAEGVGLLRTEFLLMHHRKVPSEEDQAAVLQTVLRRMDPHPVSIRLLDFGFDKRPAFLGAEHDPRRGIGWLLGHPDILRAQVRAIVRAGTSGHARVLVPFVSAVEELEAVASLLQEATEALGGRPLALGAMLETPAACLMLAALSKHCQFFTLGTNDLICHTLGIPRQVDAVRQRAASFHPAVLRLIRDAARDCRRAAVPLGICGELGADPLALPFLVGAGVAQFSMAPSQIPRARRVLCAIDRGAAEDLAEEVCLLTRASSVERALRSYLESCAVEV